MNVFSLTPQLSDFHTIRFSGSSGYFLYLNLLLSFFWLCEEGQCIYLHLYLGQKSLYLLYIYCMPVPVHVMRDTMVKEEK